jgi:hypothetical protein
MDLSTTQQILLIILASALALFLLLSIVVVILVIRLLQKLRLIVDKAEKVIESAEAVGEVFKKAAGPVGLLRLLHGLVDMASKHKRDNDNKE